MSAMTTACDWTDWHREQPCIAPAELRVQHYELNASGPDYRPDGHVVGLNLCLSHALLEIADAVKDERWQGNGVRLTRI